MKCPSCFKEIPEASTHCIFCNAVFSTDGKMTPNSILDSLQSFLQSGKVKYRLIVTGLAIAVIFIAAAAFTLANRYHKASIIVYRSTCLSNLKNIKVDIDMYVENYQVLPASNTNWTAIVKDKKYLNCPASGKSSDTITYGFNGNIGGNSIPSISGDYDGIPLVSECDNSSHLIMSDADVVKDRHIDPNGKKGYHVLTLGGSVVDPENTVTYNWGKLQLITPPTTNNNPPTNTGTMPAQPALPSTNTPAQPALPLINAPAQPIVPPATR